MFLFLLQLQTLTLRTTYVCYTHWALFIFLLFHHWTKILNNNAVNGLILTGDLCLTEMSRSCLIHCYLASAARVTQRSLTDYTRRHYAIIALNERTHNNATYLRFLKYSIGILCGKSKVLEFKVIRYELWCLDVLESCMKYAWIQVLNLHVRVLNIQPDVEIVIHKKIIYM